MIDFSQKVTVADQAAAAVVANKALIAATRYSHETGGMLINAIPVDTGRDSQQMITGAAFNASLDSTYTVNWKGPDGFITMDAPTLLAFAKAVRAHVQACFDREAVLSAAADDGSYTSDMLEKGWPVYGQVSDATA